VAAIIHLIGYPGVAADRIVLVDNHLTSSPVLAVTPRDDAGRVPDRVWQLVGAVREQVIRAIEELSPPEWSFVFTNVLRRSDPPGVPTSVPLQALALARGVPYVPVLVTCDVREHRRRVVGPGRAERGKWTNPDAVAEFVASVDLIVPAGPHRFDLDITSLAPEEAARIILDHVRSL